MKTIDIKKYLKKEYPDIKISQDRGWINVSNISREQEQEVEKKIVQIHKDNNDFVSTFTSDDGYNSEYYRINFYN